MHGSNAQSNMLNDRMAHLPKSLYIGNNDGQRIYLTRPSFDCNWYWGFGYLGNRNCHYHLDGIAKGENINFYDALKKHFGASFIVKGDAVWKFAEIVLTIYTLKKTAELFHLGGSHMTTNPAADTLKAKSDWEKEINEVLIPRQVEELYKLLLPTA